MFVNSYSEVSGVCDNAAARNQSPPAPASTSADIDDRDGFRDISRTHRQTNVRRFRRPIGWARTCVDGGKTIYRSTRPTIRLVRQFAVGADFESHSRHDANCANAGSRFCRLLRPTPASSSTNSGITRRMFTSRTSASQRLSSTTQAPSRRTATTA